MKFLKKCVTCLLAACVLLSATACGGNEYGDMTVLNVGVYDGGLGHIWLEKVAAAFEEKFKETSFEEGKVGVHIDLNPTKNEMLNDNVAAAIDSNRYMEDVYFLCDYTGVPWIINGRTLNITDMVEQKVYLDNGELADMEYDAATGKLKLKEGATAPTKSIYDKIKGSNKEGYYTSAEKLAAAGSNKEGGYYALPFENSLSGFIYDRDLFESSSWFKNRDGSYKYHGIDNLPDTMDEFFEMLDNMVMAGITPFATSTDVIYYERGLADAFLAQYEGYETAELDYTLNGTYEFPAGTFSDALIAEMEVGDYVKNENGKQVVTVNRDTGWMLAYTEGKEEMCKFMRKLFDPKYYDNRIYDNNFKYQTCPQAFILSKTPPKGTQRIAMLYEGEWWENENRQHFKGKGNEYGERDFRFFPLPEIPGQKTNQRSLGDFSCGVDIVVNAKTQYANLAKIFLQFVHSESALETFTMETGITRMYDYDLSPEQLSEISKFGQSVYKMKMTEDSGVTVVSSRAKMIADPFWEEFQMGFGGYCLSDRVGTPGTWDFAQHPSYYFVDYAGVLTGKPKITAEYFIEGMHDYYRKNWKARLKTFNELHGITE